MATVNNRVGVPQAAKINGIDAGGMMAASIQSGYDNILNTSPDGLQVPLQDKDIEFVRGSIVTQNWPEAINLLTGTIGTYVFYQRKSGVAEATGYIKHTITNPVISNMNIRFGKGGYAAIAFDFECRASDETKGILDMWGQLDLQTPPVYVSAARGGFRIISAVHGAVSIYQVTGFDFNMALPLVKACNDGDVGYTAVDARLDGLTCSGSISFQDTVIAAGHIKAQTLLTAAKANLVLTIKQAQGAANKTVTIANVDFTAIGSDDGAQQDFAGHSTNFNVANVVGTPLTLTGVNKIITIA